MEGGKISFPATDGNASPKREKRSEDRTIPCFDLHQRGDGPGDTLRENHWSVQEIDVVDG